MPKIAAAESVIELLSRRDDIRITANDSDRCCSDREQLVSDAAWTSAPRAVVSSIPPALVRLHAASP